MPNCVERKWPFRKLLRESEVLELLPSLSPDVKVAIVFQFSSCLMVINNTVNMLGIDHYVSHVDNRSIKWQVLNKSVTLEQIQNVTNSLVIKVCA